MRRSPAWNPAQCRVIDEARIVELLLLHGWGFELRTAARPEAEGEARDALGRLIALGLPFSEGPAGRRRFDPADVLNCVAWSGLEGLDPLWDEQCVPTGRRLAWEAWSAHGAVDRPPTLDPAEPRRFHLRLERAFAPLGLAAGRRVRLRVPLPIEDAALSELEVRVRPPTGVACSVSQAPGRLDAVIQVPAPQPLTLGVDIDFTARPWAPLASAAPLPPDEFDLYTRPSEGLVKVSDGVSDLASRLAGRDGDPWRLLGRLWDRFHDEMTCGVVSYDQLDPARPLDWVLERGWFDCQLGAALIVAVCRARGVPARLAGGYLLYPTAPAVHYWAEVWLEDCGWAPFDLLTWGLSRGGRDRLWRDHFFGRLDHRMTTQRLPRLFSGAGSVRLPNAWRILARGADEGIQADLYDARSGELTYQEFVAVQLQDHA